MKLFVQRYTISENRVFTEEDNKCQYVMYYMPTFYTH